MKFKKTRQVITALIDAWSTDKISHLSAALSYYTVFSLVPILMLSIMVGSALFGTDYITKGIFQEITNALGSDTSDQIYSLLMNFRKPNNNIVTAIFGILILIWGTAGFLGELKNCFNTIWDVKIERRGSWFKIIKERFFSFTIVLGVAFLLLLSLMFSTILIKMSENLYHFMPTASFLWNISDLSTSIILETLLFAAIFKFLPDIDLTWHDVLPGAFISAIFFSLGKFLLSLYLAEGNIATSYGFTASIITVLVWVYYSTQILLLGAAFTKIYKEKF